MNAGELDDLIRHMLIAIPICYSIGAAAVLISLEKESGQMLWLNGLPIQSYRVAASKLVVVLLGWLTIWFVSIVIYELIHVLHLKQVFGFPHYEYEIVGFNRSLWVFICQSFLLLSIGVMLAWRLPTAWLAIVAIFLVEMLPFFFRVFIWVANPNSHAIRYGIANDVISILCAIAFSLVFGWLGWRFAVQYWARETPRDLQWEQWTERVQSWFPNWTRTGLAKQHPKRFTRSSALIWQSGQQHFSILFTLFAMVFVSLTALLVVHYVKEFAFFPLFTLVLAFVGCFVVSWAGWLVFRTDAQRHSIRFQAERGLAPKMLWWTQHCVPFAFLCVLALLTLGVIRFALPATHDWTWLSIGFVRQFQFLMLIYALSQWISFVIPKAVFAAVVAPLVGTILAIYLWIEAGFVYPNAWIACLLIALPLVVTRLYFRSWMDGQRSWRFWAGQIGCFALLICIPQVQHLSPLWDPVMPAEFRTKLAAEASTLAKQPQTSVKFLTYDNLKQDPDRDYVERVLSKLREMFADQNNRKEWEFPDETLAIIIGDIVGSRIQIREQDVPTHFQSLNIAAKDDRSRDKVDASLELKDRYNESMGFLSKIVSLLRESSKIADQDRNDWLEIFLLRECLQEDSASFLAPASYNRIVDQISDQDARYQARRRAILLSWHRVQENPREIVTPLDRKSKKSEYRPSIGGYALYGNERWRWRGKFFNALMYKVSFVTYEMLECLEQGRTKRLEANSKYSGNEKLVHNTIQERIATAWGGTGNNYREAYEDNLDDDTEYYLPKSPMTRDFVHGSHVPCGQWYGEWEGVAASLERR